MARVKSQYENLTKEDRENDQDNSGMIESRKTSSYWEYQMENNSLRIERHVAMGLQIWNKQNNNNNNTINGSVNV